VKTQLQLINIIILINIRSALHFILQSLVLKPMKMTFLSIPCLNMETVTSLLLHCNLPQCSNLCCPNYIFHLSLHFHKSKIGYRHQRMRNLSNTVYNIVVISFSASPAQHGLLPPRPRGFLITRDAPQSIELLWTSDQLIAETST
jgi:hypothetical protein